jgi:hypothetical protein
MSRFTADEERPLTDLERMLISIVEGLYGTQTMMSLRLTPHWSSQAFVDSFDQRELIHFAPWDKPQPGDLVLCQTSPLSPFKIAEVVYPIGSDTCLLRRIGTKNTCEMSNERFIVIKGLRADQRWEGDQREFARRVKKVFKRNEWLHEWQGQKVTCISHVYAGVEFLSATSARVWVREYYGGLDGKPSYPYGIDIDWQPLPSQRSILQQLMAGGWGTRSFTEPYTPPTAPPAQEQASTEDEAEEELDYDALRRKMQRRQRGEQTE